MPFIYKENNNYLVFAENAFDNYNQDTFDVNTKIETIDSVEGLSKFIIDITTDADGNIEQSEYEQVLKVDAEQHQNNTGDEITILTGGVL